MNFPLAFQSTWPAALLLLLPLLWWQAARTHTSLSRRHLAAVTVLRSVAIALIALALMRPQWSGEEGDVSVVYAVDVSRSVSPAFIESALDWIDRADRQAQPAHSRYVAFADRAVLFDNAAALRSVPVSERAAVPGSLDQSETNLESALDEALLGLDRDAAKRVVLLTDGNQTRGDLWHMLPRLKEAGVRVFPIPAKPRDDGDAWLDGIEIPAGVQAGEPVKITVRAFAPREMRARVQLKNAAAVIGSRNLTLRPGINRIVFETRLAQTGSASLSAQIAAEGDRSAENNSITQSAWVNPRARVLYVESEAGSARYLRQALAAEGIEVAVAAPGDLPATAAALAAYDALILSDVAAESIPAAKMQAIESYVRDQGGGLLFASGDKVFGENGYTGTALEKVLPVQFSAQEKRKDLALVIVLDRSYSMKGRKMELAKEATRAALDLLQEEHQFAVVAFDSQTYVSVPMQFVRSKRKAEDLISRIQASGQTNIYPAIGIVYRMLQKTEAKAKHVILLSDGDTHAADFEGLLGKMSEEKIVVSTVAIGEDADRELMANIAKWAKGKAYTTVSAEAIPQIFIEETQRAIRSSLLEEAFKPVVSRRSDAFRGIAMEAMPELKGFVSAKARDNAEVLLTTPAELPILARWQYGLGKVVIFTSDVKNRWAVDWLDWSGYGKLWAQVTREIMRRDSGEQLDFRVSRDGGEAVVTLSALTADGRFRGDLAPRVRMIGADGRASVVELQGTGAGTYQLRVPVRSGAAPARFELVESRGLPRETTRRAGSRQLHYTSSDEYRAFPPNIELLRTLAEQTGGKLAPEIAEVFAQEGDESRTSRALWPWLALLALLAYLADIAVRRVPWAWRRFGS